MQLRLGEVLPDHGMQAWADAYAAYWNRAPVVATNYRIISGDYTGIETRPPGLPLGQIVRLSDLSVESVANGPFIGAPAPSRYDWINVSGGDFGVEFAVAFYYDYGLGGRSAADFPDGQRVHSVLGIDGNGIGGVCCTMVDCRIAASKGSELELIYPYRGYLFSGFYGHEVDWRFTPRPHPLCGGPPPPPPPAGGGHITKADAIEPDGPRQWFYLGVGKDLVTTDQDFTELARGTYAIDRWRRLRFDQRTASLVALGQRAGADADGKPVTNYSVWRSTDGGKTATKVAELGAITSSLIERDSERGLLLWFTADGSNAVSVSVSKDAGETWADPVPVKLDTGKPLIGTLVDGCQDPRTHGRVAMICALFAAPGVMTGGSILVSGDGGLTFKPVT